MSRFARLWRQRVAAIDAAAEAGMAVHAGPGTARFHAPRSMPATCRHSLADRLRALRDLVGPRITSRCRIA
jgi:hypothetical protein